MPEADDGFRDMTPAQTNQMLAERLADALAELRATQAALQAEIDRHQQTEDDLDRERRLLRTVIDNLPDQIFARDRECRFTLSNLSDARVMGVANPEALLGKDDADFYPPELAERYQADDRQVMETGQPLVEREEPSVGPGGAVRWTSTTKVPLYDSQGQVIGLVGIAHDITRRKQAEAELSESEERYRRLVELSPDAIAVHQADKVVYANSACLVLLGTPSSAEVLGRSIFDFIHPDSQPLARERLRQYAQGQTSRFVEEKFLRLDGRAIDIEVASVPIAYRGEPAVQTVLRDITDRKRADAALNEANAELARAMRLRDEFLATMSHELRSPLNTIITSTEILGEGLYGDLNDQQRHTLRNIAESGRHLLSLINDILDLSRIEAGKLTLNVGPAMVEEICQASLRLVSETALKKGLQLSLELDGRFQWVLADERRLKQMLVNLLSNGIKFTPSGGKVGLKVDGSAEAQVIRFTVWDAGIGIAPDNLSKLFKPFVQIDNRLARSQEGSGLGLSLVARMAEMHGGSVGVESELGRGSRFTIALPWTGKESGKYQEAPEPAAPLLPGVPAQPADGRRRAILIAEDDETILASLTVYLQACGYEVRTARDGYQAVSAASDRPPDLILMDIQMPDLDGLEAMRRIRRMSALGSIPIVALTALVMPGDRERCLEAGASDYLAKPVDLKTLVKVIQAHLP